MASLPGRGAQVRLDGDAQAAARGGGASRLIESIISKQALEMAGDASDGNTPDGSTATGAPALDEVLAPAGVSVGATPYAATITPTSITETINGVQVVTTFGAGTITETYGDPINQTWVTTISNGSVSKVLV